MRKMKRGFTLAELLMVIVILGILGAIALPRFYPQQEKARVSEAISMLSAIRQGELAYYLEKGGYVTALTPGSADWAKIGIDDPNGDATRKFNYTTDENGLATATRSGGGSSYAGKTIILAPNGNWTGDHQYGPANS